MNGLRFILKGGMFLDSVYGSPKEMREVIDKFVSGAFRTTGQRVLAGTCRLSGMEWALSVDEIIGINTIYLVKQPAPGYQPPPQDFAHQAYTSGPGLLYPQR